MADLPDDDDDQPRQAPQPPADEVGPAGVRRDGPGFVVAVSLAVLFGLAAVVLGVLLASENGTADGLDDLRSAAGRFGEALVTYDYHDPEAHRDGVLELATGSFRQDYEDAFDQGLGQIITQVQAISTGSVNDVFLSSVDDDQAQAVVSLDIEVSGTSGERTLTDQYVLLTLIRLDAGWRVDQVTDLSFPDGGAGPPVTDGSTTTTTAPVPTSVP
jgi:Mce-associated membrane protein